MDNAPEPQILPTGLADQTEYIEGLTPNTSKTTVTITCHAQNPVTGGAQSGVQLNFGFQQNAVKDDGGHQNHLPATPRPLGAYSRTTGRTDNNGNLISVYTAPEHTGKFGIQVSSPDTNERLEADVLVMVPNFTELAGPTGNDGYVLTGSDTYHPSNHWGKPSAIASLRQIGIDYRDTLFPEASNPNGVPGNRVLRFNDISVKWGGKFDIPLRTGDVPQWRTTGSHLEHKVGINCDISDATIPNDTVTVDGQQRNRWQVVEDASAGSYTFEARVASPYSNQTFHIELDGADVTGGLYVPNTGSDTNYQWVSIDNIWVDGGRHVISIKADGWGQEVGTFDYLNVNPYVPIYYCDPPWWEIHSCQNSGGYWDYGYCAFGRGLLAVAARADEGAAPPA